MNLFLVALALPVAVISDCLPDADHGCLNGESYNYGTQFPCGSMQQDGSQALYYWDTTGCCGQGLPFDISNSYCCYDGVHDYSSGECISWDSSFDTSCYCDSSAEKTNATVFTVESTPDIIDTSETNDSPCSTANSTYGCLNGWSYLYTKQYPCASYINKYSTTGCCNGAPYDFETQSCCKYDGDDSYTVENDPHACSCSKYGCQ